MFTCTKISYRVQYLYKADHYSLESEDGFYYKYLSWYKKYNIVHSSNNLLEVVYNIVTTRNTIPKYYRKDFNIIM